MVSFRGQRGAEGATAVPIEAGREIQKRESRTMNPPIAIRPVEQPDEAQWRKLWTGYLDFYDASVSDEVYASTFERLLSDDPWMPSGFIAETGNRAVGIVHYLYHAHC